MSAFLIVDVLVQDANGFELYRQKVASIVYDFGGKFLVRGGEYTIKQSELWSPNMLVIIEFQSRNQAERFVNSSEYKKIQLISKRTAQTTMVIVDGV